MLSEIKRPNTYSGDVNPVTSDEEVKYVINLLKEYNDKIDELIKAKDRRNHLYIFQIIIIAVLFFVPIFLINFLQIMGSFFFLYITLITIFSIVMFYLSYECRNKNKRDNYVMRRLHSASEQLVNRASQLEDHSNIGYTEKLALELRLAELEALLRETQPRG